MAEKKGIITYPLLTEINLLCIMASFLYILENIQSNKIVVFLASWAFGVFVYLIWLILKAFNDHFSFFIIENTIVLFILFVVCFFGVSAIVVQKGDTLFFFVVLFVTTFSVFYKPYYTLYILLAIYILLLLLYAILMKEKTVLSFLEMLLVWSISYLSFYIAFKKTLPKMEMHIDMAGIPFLDRLLSRKKS